MAVFLIAKEKRDGLPLGKTPYLLVSPGLDGNPSFIICKLFQEERIQMVLEDEKGYISIEFLHLSYSDSKYVEIDFCFNIESVGWGVVGDTYFSLDAIKAFSEQMALIVRGEADQFYYSDNTPYLIPKPFYWFEINRIGHRFKVHLKIHDNLEDYIEVTEIIDLDKLESFQTEFHDAYVKYSNQAKCMTRAIKDEEYKHGYYNRCRI